MLQVEENNGSLLIPPFGTGLKLLYKNKHTGKQEVARIGPGPEKNHYFAYFEQDDVDFEIEMDNSSCKDRSVRFRMEVMKKKHGFVVGPKDTWKIETMESNGKKLHFIRQSGEEGKSLVSSTASSRGISRQDASTILSQIKFWVNYEARNFVIVVKDEKEAKLTRVDVNSQTTIAELKHKISQGIEHPVGNYTVILNGKQLEDYDDNFTLEELDIKEDCQLICKKIEFPVQVKVGKNAVVFKATSWDLVQDLKKKIEEKYGIPMVQQKLYFKKNELLFNKTKLGRTGITRNGVLNVTVLDTFPLKIKIIPSNKIITIPVCSRSTIKDVLDKIEQQEGISTQQQALYLHGSQLSDDEQLLSDVGVKNDDLDSTTIFLFTIDDQDGQKTAKIQKKNPHECVTKTSFPIILKKRIDGTIINLIVCSTELVGEVKEKICKETGIPITDQKLQFRHSNMKLLNLEDDFPLELYEIKENSELRLCVPLSDENIILVWGTNEDETIGIPFVPSMTVGELKYQIEDETGVPCLTQRLIFNGSLLRYNDRTLSDYDMQKGDVIETYSEQLGGGHSCKNPSCSDCARRVAYDFSERGAITFGAKSSQTFSSCNFQGDESIKIEPFIIELRLAGVPILP